MVGRLALTHLDRLWWPEEGITKADVVDYYRAVAPVLLPHLRDRPFTMKRQYTGPRSPYEWVKDAPPGMPEWIAVSPQPAKSRGWALVRCPLVNDLDALLWMVEFGCVDLHVWTSRVTAPDRPDQALFDLDPAGVGFTEVVEAGLLLREALDAPQLVSIVHLTGGDGIHVRIPLEPVHGYPGPAVLRRRHRSASAGRPRTRHDGTLVRAPARRLRRHEDERPRTAGRRALLGPPASRRTGGRARDLGRALDDREPGRVRAR